MTPVRRRRPVLLVALLAVVVLLTPGSGADSIVPTRGEPLANSLARTPPMGWDTWNAFGCDVDEELVEREADALVATGLRDAGYRYVVIDDCWFDPSRTKAGDLRGSARFPHGMKAIGDYLHARGLEFGLYESPTAQTCAQLSGAYPGETGSLGHERQDARRFAAWGVDYLKYDWCSPSGSLAEQASAFARMRDALADSGRPILLSINPNSAHATTGPLRYWGDVSNAWRTTQDITDAWSTGHTGASPMGVDDIVRANLALSALAAPGGFNDPDMLEIGHAGLTAEEQRSQLALWAMMAAPLIAGNDIAHEDAATTALLAQPMMLAIDQDPLGRQARQVGGDATSRVLSKPLSNGDLAVAVLNESNHSRTLSVNLDALGLVGLHTWTNAWTGVVDILSGSLTAAVPSHGTAVYVVSARST